MTIKLSRQCTSDGDSNPTCHADFTINGRPGHQKLEHGETVHLEAVHQNPDAHYHWDVISTPPNCEEVLTPIGCFEAKLLLPQPGAYVVQLSVRQCDCSAQTRYILWVLTPRLLYSIPATGEAVRLHGKPEWAGDLARLMLDVDQNLPTEAEKWAMAKANTPGRDNPFATVNDLPPPYSASPETLTPEQLAAIRLANDPGGQNPFLTEKDLHEKPKIGVTQPQKDALDLADHPSTENPFITQNQLPIGVSPEQKRALNAADKPDTNNPYVTQSQLPPEVTPLQKEALDKAYNPSAKNPFVTYTQLPRGVTANQNDALDNADDPGAENPFITKSQLPRGVTADQNDALDNADNPNAQNPFITKSQLPHGVTADQNDALDNADNPNAQNPFITKSQLPHGVTADQNDALDNADNPNAQNPFVTQSQLPSQWSTGVTHEQKEALNHADEPGAENPFITKNQLPRGVTADQNDALDNADNPNAQNPFITKSQLPHGVTAEQNDALDKADNPNAQNPFITKSQLPRGVTAEQKEALSHADEPSAKNPFVTQSQLPSDWPIGVTHEQKAALDKADHPSGGNPFVTESRLADWAQLPPNVVAGLLKSDDPSTVNPFVTQKELPDGGEPGLIGLTPLQDAALDAAEGQDGPHQPGADNPFATKSMVPTKKQKAALDAAHKPSHTNPFITKDALPATQLTVEQKAAIDEADNPTGKNSFVTQSELPKGDKPSHWPIGLTILQNEALDAAEAIGAPKDRPSKDNPFITQSRLPKGDCPHEWPIGVTQQQRDALDAANSPSEHNAVATMADLALVGITTRVAAAGRIDLSTIGIPAGKTLGGLTVVSNDQPHGLATLAFAGYSLERNENYVVKALPVNHQAGKDLRSFTIVQFVDFTEHGFVLHMSQPLNDTKKNILGTCMIEVSEMIDVAQQPLTIEQAIRYYYTLIRQQHYEEAWPMLSKRFKNTLVPPLKSYEEYVRQWESSGPAEISHMEQVEISNSAAIYILDLYYPKALFSERKHRIRYEFEHNEQEGHARFAYWLFVDGYSISHSKKSPAILAP